jgi:hypothetical protein
MWGNKEMNEMEILTCDLTTEPQSTFQAETQNGMNYTRMERKGIYRLSGGNLQALKEIASGELFELRNTVYAPKKWWQYILFWIKPKIVAYDVMWMGNKETESAK